MVERDRLGGTTINVNKIRLNVTLTSHELTFRSNLHFAARYHFVWLCLLSDLAALSPLSRPLKLLRQSLRGQNSHVEITIANTTNTHTQIVLSKLAANSEYLPHPSFFSAFFPGRAMTL